MNKYQEAYENVKKMVFYGACRLPVLEKIPIDVGGLSLDKLQELVERATPKKPIKRYYTEKYGNHGTKKRVDIRCSCCNSSFTNGARASVGVFASREKKFIETVKEIKYCGFCGQALDWSEEE